MSFFKTITRGGFGAMSKTKDLKPSMQPSEVKALLGEPVGTELKHGKMMWRYTLHQWTKGWVPFYLVFSGETGLLEGWYADEKEFAEYQKKLMDVMTQIQGGSGNHGGENSINAGLVQNTAWNKSRAGDVHSR